MTDSADDHEDSGPDATRGSDPESGVPAGTDWELVVQLPFDADGGDELTSAVITAVAEAEGVRPREVKTPPLYEVVDVSALESAFFGSQTIDGSGDGHLSVEFMYRGHRILVRSDGWVQVYEVAEE